MKHADQLGVDYYSCEEAIRRLNDFLDHELTEEERCVVLKHLDICKPCLNRFSFEETLLVSIRTKLCAIKAPDSVKQRLKGILRCGDASKKNTDSEAQS